MHITSAIITHDNARDREVVVIFREYRVRYYQVHKNTVGMFARIARRAGGVFQGKLSTDRYTSELITL